MFCCTVLVFLKSSLKKNLVALISLSHCCLVTVNVTVTPPHGAINWSRRCDCSIRCSYSLTFETMLAQTTELNHK